MSADSSDFRTSGSTAFHKQVKQQVEDVDLCSCLPTPPCRSYCAANLYKQKQVVSEQSLTADDENSLRGYGGGANKLFVDDFQRRSAYIEIDYRYNVS